MYKSKRTLLFPIIIISILLGCKEKKETVSPAIPVPPYYLKGTFNGTSFNCLIENGYGRSILPNSANNGSPYFASQSMSWLYHVDSIHINNNISIYIMKTFSGYPDSTALESIIHTGTFPFGNSITTTPGVEVIWYDGTKSWTTRGDQTGSTFEITGHIVDNAGFSIYYPHTHVSQGNFSCKIYDGLGNSKTLTGFTFKGFSSDPN